MSCAHMMQLRSVGLHSGRSIFAVFYDWVADVQARTCTTLALCAIWKFQRLRA